MVAIIIHSPPFTGPISASLARAWSGASGVEVTSGGYRRYRTSGAMIRAVSAGTDATLNQVSQGDASWHPREEASFRQRRFWAAAVRNRAEELPAFWGSLGGKLGYNQHCL